MNSHKLLLALLFATSLSFAQKDWANHDFEKENDRTVYAKGSSVKSLQKNKSFVNSYIVGQATNMKGSEKKSGTAIYSEVGIQGVDVASYQKIVDGLYLDFTSNLKKAGITFMTGEEIMNTKTAKKYIKKKKEYYVIENIGSNTSEAGEYKVANGTILGYPVGSVRNDIKFQPENKTIYKCDHLLKAGLFYQNMFTKEKVNLISIAYYVTYVDFDGGRGYKKITLETEPKLSVNAKLTILPVKGKAIDIHYEKPITGSTDWSFGLEEVRDNESTAAFLGLARSTGAVLKVDPQKYLNEVEAIVMAIQKDIINTLKEKF